MPDMVDAAAHLAALPSGKLWRDTTKPAPTARQQVIRPYPSTTPDMVDVAAHLAVQPSMKFCTTRQSPRAPRANRQQAPTGADPAANDDNADSTSKMSKS